MAVELIIQQSFGVKFCKQFGDFNDAAKDSFVGIVNKMLAIFHSIKKSCCVTTISIGCMWGIPERITQKKWLFPFFIIFSNSLGLEEFAQEKKKRILGSKLFCPKVRHFSGFF